MKTEYIKQIAEALQAPTENSPVPVETILVCASRTEGRRILSAVTAQGHILVGVRPETPFSLAKELCGAWLSEEGAPHLMESLEGAELVRQCMNRHNGKIFSGVNAKTLSATAAVFSAFQEVRLARVAWKKGVSAKLDELEELYQIYVKAKNGETSDQDETPTEPGEKKIDRVDLLQKALELAAADQRLSAAHYVVLGDYAPSPLERDLLERLSARNGLTVVPLPCAEGVELPMNAMAEDLPRENAVQTVKAANSSFFACRGIETEAQFPIRDILAQGWTLEDCTVVYLNSSYAQPIYEAAARYHVPITMGEGLPLMGSQLYTTLKKVYALPQSEFYGEDVCALLESGSCKPKKYPVKLAERMRRKKVGWGKERYVLAYTDNANVEEAENDVRPKAMTDEDWTKLLKIWEEFLTRLLQVAEPEDGTNLEQQKEDVLQLLSYCYNRTESERAAIAKTKELVGHIVGLDEGETLLSRLLSLMETASYMSSSPKPGMLHCTSVAQSVCATRKHLYVVGFSRYAVQGNQRESPILLDLERTALGGLKTSIQKGFEQEYRLLRMLLHHEGDFVLSYPDFDSDGMLKQLPAPFFVEVSHGKQCDHVTYIPDKAQTAAEQMIKNQWVLVNSAKAAPLSAGDSIQLQPKKTRQKVLEDLTYSPTSLEEALKCPYMFYLKRVMKIRAPQPVERNEEKWLSASETGTFCHKVLEEHYDPARTKTLDEIFKEEFAALEKKVPMPNNPRLKQEAEQSLRTMVDNAIRWTATKQRTVLATEKKFGPIPMTFGQWTLQVEGCIDRVDRLQQSGELSVLDYKTGDAEDFQKNLHLHWQHYLYTLAEESLSVGQPPVAEAVYLFPKDQLKQIDLKEDPDLRDEISARIEWLMNHISREGVMPDCAPGFRPETDVAGQTPKKPKLLEYGDHTTALNNCRNICEFAEICPAVKAAKEGR